MSLLYSLFFSFTVPNGLKFDLVQTSMVRAPEEENLRLESLSQGIVMDSPKDILMDSYGGGLKIKSLSDMKFTSKNGKVSFNILSLFFASVSQCYLS